MKKDVYPILPSPIKVLDQIKLYLDESILEGDLARLLINSEFNVLSAETVNNFGLSDCEHLKFAISQNRTLLTYNAQAFLDLQLAFMIEEVPHHGIIILNPKDHDLSLQRLLELITHAPATEMNNRLEYLYS